MARSTQLFLALTLASAPLAAQAAAPLTGVWLDESGRAGIDIEPCGDSVCGRISWLKVPLNDKGEPKVDIHNPQPELQGRKICGLEMLSGFAPDGSGGWEKGLIYDPATGKTYKSNMHVMENGNLSVRGYVGIPLFGQSQTWTRPAAQLPKCG